MAETHKPPQDFTLRLRRYARWRRLWIFNPKGWGRGASVERALDEEGKAPRRG